MNVYTVNRSPQLSEVGGTLVDHQDMEQRKHAASGSLESKLQTYLFQLATLGPHKHHTVVIVDIGSDRSNPIPAGSVKSHSLYWNGASQWLVNVQTTEVIIYWDWLEGGENI